MVNLAIFDSGNGYSTENLIKFFNQFYDSNVSCIICNTDSKFKNLRRYGIKIYNEKQYIKIDDILTHHNIHYIILSGYMDKIPPIFCQKYKNKIINITHSLLPKYGEPGYYGNRLYKNALSDKTVGISIYFVNEEYYKGKVLFQKEVKVENHDDIKTLKSKCEDLESKFYPKVIFNIIKETFKHLYQ